MPAASALCAASWQHGNTAIAGSTIGADRASFVFVDSYSPIFEDHIEGKKDGRNGSEQRLQCEGHLWEDALKAWLEDEKTKLIQQREVTERRKAEEEKADGATPARKKIKPGANLAVKGKGSNRDPYVGQDYLQDRLWMGLAILKDLAHRIHEGVLNTDHLKTEHGCESYAKGLDMRNTSLLVSVPRKLEPYPGRTGAKRNWMGAEAVRFHQEQRGTVPAVGAAPAAEEAAPPAAKAAAPPAADGKVRTWAARIERRILAFHGSHHVR